MKRVITEEKTHPALSEIDQRQKEWINFYNNGNSDINLLYLKNTLLFSGHGEVLQGIDIIREFYAKISGCCRIIDYKADYCVQLKENPDKIYETGRYLMETGECCQYLILWSLSEGRWMHEMEVLTKKDIIHQVNDPKITSARKQWVKLANAHNAYNLAKELYTENFVYLNRGQIYTGYKNLAEAYSYMNQADFKVNLVPEISIMVQPDLAYEIGTWTSYGTGSYIILWELQSGEWKIRFDSNW